MIIINALRRILDGLELYLFERKVDRYLNDRQKRRFK